MPEEGEAGAGVCFQESSCTGAGPWPSQNWTDGCQEAWVGPRAYLSQLITGLSWDHFLHPAYTQLSWEVVCSLPRGLAFITAGLGINLITCSSPGAWEAPDELMSVF